MGYEGNRLWTFLGKKLVSEGDSSAGLCLQREATLPKARGLTHPFPLSEFPLTQWHLLS